MDVRLLPGTTKMKLKTTEEEYFWQEGNQRSQGFMRIVDARIAKDINLLVWVEMRVEDEQSQDVPEV